MVDKKDKTAGVEDTQVTPDESDGAAAATQEVPQEVPAGMADELDKESAGEDTKESVAAPASAAVAAPPARRGSAVAGLALLLSLVALAVSGWLYYLSTTAEEAAQPGSSIDVRAELDAHARKLSQTAASELQSVQDASAELQRGLQQELQALRQNHEDRYEQLLAAQISQRQRLLAVTTTDRSDWMLAEAEYLLRLASQRIVMAGDADSAIALLGAADGILLELDDSELFPVRAAIATDLAALRALPQIDVEGTWLRLQALIGEVDALVLFELPTAVATTAPPEGADWEQRLARGFRAALDKISSYVVVTSRATPYKPMLSPQWEGMVRQNLRMLLEQARAALLSGNQTLYRHSLENTRRWLNEFFRLEESGVSALDKELQDLLTITISRKYPDINGSLSALKSMINTRHMVAEGQ